MIESYLSELETLIRKSGEPLEGNCFYLDGSFNRHPSLLPKQANLIKAASFGHRILEVGFNAGHSALLFLLHNPNAHVTCFDLGNHSYSKLCYEYLESRFPNRLKIVWGNSLTTLPTYVMNHIHESKFDLIHIDGGHTREVVLSDLHHTRLLSHSNTYVIYDDIWLPDLADLYMNGLRDVHLKTVNGVFEPTPQYAHQLCRFIRPSIALCTLVIGEEFREVTKYSLRTKIDYCVQHHLDLIVDSSFYDPSRPPAWSKIRLMEHYLHDYDYLWWIDADTYIMNPTTPPGHFIINNRLYNDKEMVVSHDWKMINTGVWIVKNTPFSHQFLRQIYQQEHLVEHGNWEQTAFIELYEKNVSNAQDRIHNIYHLDFNSYWFNYEWGHFLIHFCGCRKLPALRLMMDSYCPVQREGESQEVYQARLHWIQHDSQREAQEKLAAMN